MGSHLLPVLVVFLIQTHLELLLAVIQLQEQAMGSVPVPINNVCPAVAVEVRQSDAPAVLHGVLHACGDIRSVAANFRGRLCPRREKMVSHLPAEPRL